MDSQCFDDGYFKNLLRIDGNFLKRMFYRKVVKISTEFYDDYVKWCNKHNKYIDFIQPLCWHLFCCGVRQWKINMYMNNVRYRIEEYLKNSKDSMCSSVGGLNG